MQINDIIHGFRVESVKDIPEMKARLWRMKYEKNGAELVWIDRDDECGNKVFGIGFKTIPTDSTGVFHIIEHSVLCGSDKYPCKDPFVELIKSSVNTFLNAMTFGDKTVYPVASRNDTDFLNLTDVYLDAVFHPLSIKSPLSFRQEGWHYEIDGETGKVRRNGVVYNEMKGAFAKPERTLFGKLEELLFPDNCYGFCSGGDPAYIADLTYEQFLEAHRRYYSATNARIFLDGRIPFEETFAKLDSYLSGLERVDVDSVIPMQKPVSPEEYVGEYAAGEGEPLENRAMSVTGYVFTDFSDREKIMAADMLFDALAGSDESPLVKPILDEGLAESVSFDVDYGIQQPFATVFIRNCDENSRQTIRDKIDTLIREQIEKGIDRSELEATLNCFEFEHREGDSGSEPRGLQNGLSTYDGWLYGGDPALYLETEKIFAALRSHLGKDDPYFENLLKEIFIDCPHKASVTLVPSRTLAARTVEDEEARIAKAAADWTDEDKQRVITEYEELRAFQDEPTTPEQLASLPVLRISDIKEEPAPIKYSVEDIGGCTVVKHAINTNGIIYGELAFDISDLTDDELTVLTQISGNIGQLATAKHSALEIIKLTKGQLGESGTGFSCYRDHGNDKVLGRYFCAVFSALESQKNHIIELVPEILNTTKYDDGSTVALHLKQEVTSTERAIASNGAGYGLLHSGASCALTDAFNEKIRGIYHLRRIQELSADVEKTGPDALTAKMTALAKKVFDRSRITLSITDNTDTDWILSLLESFPASGKKVVPKAPELLPRENLGVVIPADTSFASMSSSFLPYDNELRGQMLVADQIISYDYLWGEVRVRGGAYGSGLSFMGSGRLGFYSYRDPRAAGSVDTFRKAPDALRRVADSDEPIEKFILSSLKASDPVMSPHTEFSRNSSVFLSGSDTGRILRIRRETLETTKEDLKRVADLLEKSINDSVICVIGSEQKIKECGDILDRIEQVK